MPHIREVTIKVSEIDKESLSETDIRTKFITPAIEQAGWDLFAQEVRTSVSVDSSRQKFGPYWLTALA